MNLTKATRLKKDFQESSRSKVLALGRINYELHSLGWHAFQQLCLSVTREVLGQTVLSFLDSKDGGRDGAFQGRWRGAPRQGASGNFVVQCKFFGDSGHNLRKSEIFEELEKAKRLVQLKKCDNYLLMTNAAVSGHTEEELSNEFKDAGVRYFACLGYTWICNTIRDCKRLRMLVPRVYGLGDLGQILDERAYDQANALLSSLQDDLSKFVLTNTYHRSAIMLEKHGFVLLLGEPAAGKSTIAATLAMAAIDQWGCSTLKIDEPAGIAEHWNPHEPTQFFWVDDAFGVTHYEPSLAYGWNRAFSKVQAAMKNGARIVMTSRDYIYNDARADLKRDAFPLLNEGQVVIDVHELALEEKRQILYNHLRLGTQGRDFLGEIKPHLEGIAANVNFIPEIARRLGNPTFTKDFYISEAAVTDFVDHPRQFLRDVLSGLDLHSRAALALIFMSGGMLPSPLRLGEGEYDALARLGSTLAKCAAALNSLRDSLVRYVVRDGNAGWIFKHPTIADAFADLMLGNPELMAIYLKGTTIEELVQQVSCGDTGKTGAVIVPENLFDLVLKRLLTLDEGWAMKHLVYYFLTYKCNTAFLRMFLNVKPSVYERISDPGLYLSVVPEVPLAHRLYECGLLPERYRKSFVDKLIDYAVKGEDAYLLSSNKLRGMLEEAELVYLRNRIKKDLIPRLDELLSERKDDYSFDQDPEEYMTLFVESLETYAKEFSRSKRVKQRIFEVRKAVVNWIDRTTARQDESKPVSRLSTQEVKLPEHAGVRSIFDDIDA